MSNISTCEKGESMASCLQIGVSSFLWRQQHVVGHHTHTNLETDPDIRASDQDVRRVAPHHKRQWYHVRPCSTLTVPPEQACNLFLTPSPHI